MTIQTRFLSAVAMVVVMMSMAGIYGIVQLGAIGNEFKEVAEEDLPLTSRLANMSEAALSQSFEIERALRRYAEAEARAGAAADGQRKLDLTKFEEAAQRFAEHSKDFERELAAAQELLHAGKSAATGEGGRSEVDRAERKLAELSAKYTAFHSTAGSVLALVRQDKGAEVVALELRLASENEAMDAAQTEIEREVGQFTEESARAVESHEQSAVTWMIILTGTTLFAAFGLAWVMIKQTTKVIEESVGELATATAELMASTAQQASGAQEQSSAVTQTVTTVDEVAQTAEQARERAGNVADVAQRSADAGAAGADAASQSVDTLRGAKTQVDEIGRGIGALVEKTQVIREIMATVNDIAEQTHVLSLNAAIEASRAGEQGKGFTVVASEVKALAEQSKKATARVRQILGEIEETSTTCVRSSEMGARSMEGAMKAVVSAGDVIRRLRETIDESARAATQIVASANQQATGILQVHDAMKAIRQTTEQSVASSQQVSGAAQNLGKVSSRLRGLVGLTNGVAH